MRDRESADTPIPRPHAELPAPPDRVGRDGLLTAVFERRGTRTILSRCRYTLPLQVLSPLALEPTVAMLCVLNPTGGLVGGDRLTIDVDVGPGGHVLLTTPSATKVYRTVGPPAVQDVTLRLAAGATVEWVPDHTIPFAGSSFSQTIRADLGVGSRLIVVDAFAAGRVARGEAWHFARLHSTLSVRDADGILLHDRFLLDGRRGDGLGATEGRSYFATVAVVGGDAIDLASDLASALPPDPGVVTGVARLARAGLLVRCLASDAPSLTRCVEAVWAEARRRLLGALALDLRKP